MARLLGEATGILFSIYLSSIRSNVEKKKHPPLLFQHTSARDRSRETSIRDDIDRSLNRTMTGVRPSARIYNKPLWLYLRTRPLSLLPPPPPAWVPDVPYLSTEGIICIMFQAEVNDPEIRSRVLSRIHHQRFPSNGPPRHVHRVL